MLSCTKVLRPGLGRLGQLTENVSLPRSVDTGNLLAGSIGAVVGGLIGSSAFSWAGSGYQPVMGGAAVGGLAASALVGWRPWRGEHFGRVLWVKFRAMRGTHKMMCPGSERLAVWDIDGGQHACATCRRVLEPVDGLVPEHEWRRRLYIGIMPIPTPHTGPIRIVPSSVQVPDEAFRPTGAAMQDARRRMSGAHGR